MHSLANLNNAYNKKKREFESTDLKQKICTEKTDERNRKQMIEIL